MKLAQDLGVEVTKVIGNKIRSPKEETFLREQFTKDELLGLIRFEDELSDVAMGNGEQEILTGGFKASMEEIFSQITQKS